MEWRWSKGSRNSSGLHQSTLLIFTRPQFRHGNTAHRQLQTICSTPCFVDVKLSLLKRVHSLPMLHALPFWYAHKLHAHITWGTKSKMLWVTIRPAVCVLFFVVVFFFLGGWQWSIWKQYMDFNCLFWALLPIWQNLFGEEGKVNEWGELWMKW